MVRPPQRGLDSNVTLNIYVSPDSIRRYRLFSKSISLLASTAVTLLHVASKASHNSTQTAIAHYGCCLSFPLLHSGLQQPCSYLTPRPMSACHCCLDVAGSSPVIMQLMREGAKCGQKNNHQRFVQKLDSLNRHTGLQAALQEQLQHSLASWQDSLSKLLHACPFLTKLDLSKCAAILSADDYDKLMSANSTQHTHPCAGAVMRQRHLPVNVELLLPMLQPLTCLRHISFQLCKVGAHVPLTVSVMLSMLPDYMTHATAFMRTMNLYPYQGLLAPTYSLCQSRMVLKRKVCMCSCQRRVYR